MIVGASVTVERMRKRKKGNVGLQQPLTHLNFVFATPLFCITFTDLSIACACKHGHRLLDTSLHPSGLPTRLMRNLSSSFERWRASSVKAPLLPTHTCRFLCNPHHPQLAPPSLLSQKPQRGDEQPPTFTFPPRSLLVSSSPPLLRQTH
jgi:hypothetical protein